MKENGNAEVFSRNLNKYVKLSGAKGKDIAKAVGVAATTFSCWMTGQKFPRPAKIDALAKYFGINVKDFYDDGINSKEVKAKTIEAKLLCAGVDRMPEADRERALEMMKLVFAQYADYFEKGETT